MSESVRNLHDKPHPPTDPETGQHTDETPHADCGDEEPKPAGWIHSTGYTDTASGPSGRADCPADSRFDPGETRSIAECLHSGSACDCGCSGQNGISVCNSLMLKLADRSLSKQIDLCKWNMQKYHMEVFSIIFKVKSSFCRNWYVLYCTTSKDEIIQDHK